MNFDQYLKNIQEKLRQRNIQKRIAVLKNNRLSQEKPRSVFVPKQTLDRNQDPLFETLESIFMENLD